MILVISGPQASGKGTQGDLLAEKLGLFHMESGKMFRKLAKTDERIRKMVDGGELIPSEETVSLMEKAIMERGQGVDNVIFDGFPRAVDQYEFFKKWLQEKGKKIDCVIYLEISDEEAEKRLSARRTDEKTGKVYNLITNPPGPEVKKENLFQRDDDKPEAIRRRLSIFHKNTEPMLTRIDTDGLLVRVNGERPIDVIFQDILAKLKERGLYNG